MSKHKFQKRFPPDRTKSSIVPVGKYHLTHRDPSEMVIEPTLPFPKGLKPLRESARTWALYRFEAHDQSWHIIEPHATGQDFDRIKKYVQAMTNRSVPIGEVRVVGFSSASRIKTILQRKEMTAREDYYVHKAK